ncbi:hypothetical protein NZK35_11370 [Stieleria sp. ICT_E10.1]|uniref:hypothetical protein n=1 Tax=Stieleria sedimenti TaxID=2976331 RepID=UPI00217FC929|nr:hypothetical protein [Stieleria sedimenti]MCS7467242.1 hypothetical protein [Stieleria sedimenti]
MPQTVRLTDPGVFPVRIATLPFFENENGPEVRTSTIAAPLRGRATPGEADEPWMYPLTISDSPDRQELNSLAMSGSYVESGGIRISEATSRVIHAEVASFGEIVKWYSAKLGDTKLSQALEAFDEHSAGEPDFRQDRSVGFAVPTTTHLTYRFTPDAKSITILHAEDEGDRVAISLLGTKTETAIEVIRRFAMPADRDGAIDVAD